MVNSVLSLFGTNWRFLISMGFTQVVDAIGAELGGVGKIAGFIVCGFIAGVVVLFGKMAASEKGWAFVVGMGLFAMDGVLSLFLQDWVGAAFHAYALFCLWQGYSKLRELRTL